LWGLGLNNQKRICFVASYPFSEPVLRNRLTPFLEQGSKLGYQVIVCLPESSKPLPDIKDVTFLQIKSVNVKSRNFIKRAFAEVIIAFRLSRMVPKKLDYVVVTIPSMFLFIFKYGSRGSKKILDVRDLTWEYLDEGNPAQRIFKYLFRFFFRKRICDFDLIACTNYKEKFYIDHYLSQKHALVVSNGVSRDQFVRLSSLSVSSLLPKEKIVISYVGNVGLAQNLSTFVSAAKEFPNIEFNIVGEGTDFSRIKGLSYSAKNIKTHGRIAWEDVLNIYNETDVLYAQLSENYATAVPSKLYEYLATGRPLIYGGCGEAKEVLTEFDGVHVVPPDNSTELKKVINEIVSNFDSNRVLEENISIIKQKFIREDSVIAFFKNLKDIDQREGGV
jgi:glycosyltransferase involved in cell wall biosynthesis